MAATLSRRRPATPDARSGVDTRSTAVRSALLVIALACAAAGWTIAGAYPLRPLLVMALFAAWIAFATIRFAWAWPAALALIPALTFATSTGWIVFEETDLMILATAAGGYASWAIRGAEAGRRDRAAPALSIVSWLLAVLFAGSAAIALARGAASAGGLSLAPFDWTAGYESPQNGVRLFKSFAFAVLTLPLFARECRRAGGLDRFGTAMTAGLGLCALLVVQERLAFTGLLSFSEDYRVTGPFWEMQMGGAALDGYLALTIPFAVREALQPRHRLRFGIALGVLALAAYAALVTFSRGVYAAVPLSLVVVFVLLARQRTKIDRGAAWTLIAKAVVLAVVVAFCGALVFRHGGYRATFAAFLALALAIPVDLALRRLATAGLVQAAVIAAVAVALGLAAAAVLPKGAYVVFAIAFCATAAAVWRAERVPRATTAVLAVAGWIWLCVCVVGIARFWGGPDAFHDSAVVLAGLLALVVAASRLPRSIWPTSRREQLVAVGIAGTVLGAMTVFAAGAYMTGRFSTSENDLQYRLAHWRNGLGRLHGADWILGKGLGRFPATSLFEPADSGGQGVAHLVDVDGDRHVRLAAPHVRYLGFYELFRLAQRVDVRPRTRYLTTVVARVQPNSALHIEVCARHLLYVGDCQVAELPPIVDATQVTGWHAYRFAFDSGALGDAPWWAPRPAVLALATGGQVDVRDVRLVGPDGIDLVANGDFHQRRTHWFSTSDRYHLPWHIKNLALAVLFDQGVSGLALFAALVGGALLRTAIGRAHRHPDAPFVAAAIVGYGVIGAFDSLLDVPRVAFLFYLVVLLGLMLRNPHRPGATMVVPPPAPAPPPAPTPVDDASARARRRQQAFGTRRRTAG